MTPSKIARQAAAAALDKKCAELVILKVSKLTTLADYYIICSGSSGVQLRAIADEVEKRLADGGVSLRHSEGYRSATWILLDFGSVVVHIFKNDSREFYGLERLWGDASRLEPESFIKADDEDELF